MVAASGKDAYGHEAHWDGETVLKNFVNLPNGEQHIHVETTGPVALLDTNTGAVEEFE